MTAEWALVASLLALVAGPLLHRLTRGAGSAVAFLDGFIAVAILGMVVVEIVPNALAAAGWPAWAGLAVGIFGPTLAEGRFGTRGTHRAALWVALGGMVFHAVADGLALATIGPTGRAHGLEYAVILHRLPDGLAVWWLASDRLLGPRSAPWLVLGLLAAATCVGFFVGAISVGALGQRSIGFFGAVVAGLLMHVVGHSVGHGDGASSRRVAGLGGLVGLSTVMWLSWRPDAVDHGTHAHTSSDAFFRAFTDLFIAGAPALLVAYGFAALIAGFIRGPAYHRLLPGGVSVPASMAICLVGAQVGLDAVWLSLPLLGPEMALLRIVAALILALVVGALARTLVARHAPSAHGDREGMGDPVAPPPPSTYRLLAGFREAIDTSGPWIVIGLAIAALSSPGAEERGLTGIPGFLQLGLFAALGASVRIRAGAAIPVTAVWMVGGLTPGAALAFLLTAPSTHPAVLGPFARLHGRRAAGVLTLAIVGAAIALGGVVDLVLPGLSTTAVLASAAPEPGLVGLASAMLLAGLFLLSFVRQGPRGYLGRLWESGGHDHAHGHDAVHGGPAKPALSA